MTSGKSYYFNLKLLPVPGKVNCKEISVDLTWSPIHYTPFSNSIPMQMSALMPLTEKMCVCMGVCVCVRVHEQGYGWLEGIDGISSHYRAAAIASCFRRR